jgi:hypothetical protein
MWKLKKEFLASEVTHQYSKKFCETDCKQFYFLRGVCHPHCYPEALIFDVAYS